MDPEEEYFQRMMAALGAKPLLEQERQPSSRRDESAWDEGEKAEFLAAMETLETVPVKDELPQPQSEAFRKLKSARVKQPRWEECLDLHGKTAEEAVTLLAGFVARSFARNIKTVVVVTGKGKHSQGGVAVLKPLVENWIVQKGKRYIASYAEAPRAYGGRGAFLIYLR